VNVSPNPFSDYITINKPNSYDRISFELFDIQGRKIMTKEVGNNENINMEGLIKGLYFYKLNIDGKKQNGKLIKE
jgi:hypothetical protein